MCVCFILQSVTFVVSLNKKSRNLKNPPRLVPSLSTLNEFGFLLMNFSCAALNWLRMASYSSSCLAAFADWPELVTSFRKVLSLSFDWAKYLAIELLTDDGFL